MTLCDQRATNGVSSSLKNGGFSLVELLVAVGIALALCSLIAGVYGSALKKAAVAKELSAGRMLISAYLTAGQENNGVLLPGYDRTSSSLTLSNGQSVHGQAVQRYPFRLAEYFDFNYKGALLASSNYKQINADDSYLLSCYPTFGMNYYFVGGNLQADKKTTFEADCATRLSQVSTPSSLLVFASGGGYDQNSKIVEGYCILTPPYVLNSMWSGADYKEGASPGSYGNLHFRHNKKAVCVFLDGSVRLHGLEELRDMRLWSYKAKALDNPNFTVSF